jgi:hypothetical protein
MTTSTRKKYFRKKKSNKKIKSRKPKKLRKSLIKRKNMNHVDRAQKKQDVFSSYKLFIYD